MAKSIREQSRENFSFSNITVETIVAGSLQRVADAMEIMAKDRVELERNLDFYKQECARRGNTIQQLESEIKGLKISKSRFKNQLDKLKGTDQ